MRRPVATALMALALLLGPAGLQADSLREIYEQIDRMEKTEIESVKFVDYKEAFLPFVLTALLLIGLEMVLRETVFRKIP